MFKLIIKVDNGTSTNDLAHSIRLLHAELVSRIGYEETERLLNPPCGDNRYCHHCRRYHHYLQDCHGHQKHHHHSGHDCQHSVAVRLEISVLFKDLLWSATGDDMGITIRDDSLGLSLLVSAVDAKGNPAILEAGEPPLTWTLQGDAPGALVLTPAADGLSCDVTVGTGLGKCQVKAERAADDAKGVKDILGLLDVEVVSGPAVNLVVNAVEKTAPAPAEAVPVEAAPVEAAPPAADATAATATT